MTFSQSGFVKLFPIVVFWEQPTLFICYMLLFCEHVVMLGGGSSVGGECYLRYLLFGMTPLD